MTRSLSEARKILTNYLQDMGMSPHNLRITEYDSQGVKNHWQLTGEFEDGFLGSKILFESLFNYESDTMVKFRVIGKEENSTSL